MEEELLSTLLNQPQVWKSVRQSQPTIEKIYTGVRLGDNYRLWLQINHQCRREEVPLHTHPYQLAIHVISGSYELGLGKEHELLSTLELKSGSYYEMLNPLASHYVFPQGDLTCCAMLCSDLSEVETETLSEARMMALRQHFSLFYRHYRPTYYRRPAL